MVETLHGAALVRSLRLIDIDFALYLNVKQMELHSLGSGRLTLAQATHLEGAATQYVPNRPPRLHR